MTDPQDTLLVLGGPSLTHVDVGQVRAAAQRLAEATDRLRSATAGAALARAVLDRVLWTAGLGWDDPALPARVRWARALADDTAVALADRAEQCAVLSGRLLRAAGLYEHAEGAVEQLVGGMVATATGALGFAVTRIVTDPVVGTPLRAAGSLLIRTAAESAPDPDDPDRPAVPATTPEGPATPEGLATPEGAPSDGGVTGALLREVAPFVDEAVGGAATGVALGALEYTGRSVTDGARVLATAVEEVLGTVEVHVLATPAEAFGVGLPAWHDRPLARVDDALAATADLYPAGNGVPGRELPGTPPGTVAVQEVTRADGSTSWTVLIPGTQELLSTGNPFDLATDLDLMAEMSADVAAGVLAALADAGAGPDEPVVLVGHSLGGIAAVSLAASPQLRGRVAGVVTAGAPTATFRTPPGVPVLHLENDEELVSPLDGRSSTENPATRDRVTVGRALADSGDPLDRAASGSVAAAHSVGTHLRTLRHARDAGSVPVTHVSARLDALLGGERAETRYYRVRRGEAG
ncbi:hypothetical protein GCM10023216_11260 [Isoptericola chiayiensis]|uniref:PGAP1 family protein n=1 Tax=Isoptericola chiayiensis TaxID=579446 RepID=A0ABP8YB39_9MICO|nr:hypothetical protein [Isoptericola chiayiensis]NOW00763.1 hypothetical protein [Isoptericola chiayiensis]